MAAGRSIIIVYIEISREVYQKVHILTGYKPVSKDSDLVERFTRLRDIPTILEIDPLKLQGLLIVQ